MLPAHAGVLYADVAVALTPDVKGTREPTCASVFRPNAQSWNGGRAGCLPGNQFLELDGDAGALNDWIMCMMIGSYFENNLSGATPFRR